MKTLITIIRSVVAPVGVAGRNSLSIQFMKTNLNLLQTRIFRAVALGIGSFFDLAAAPPSWVTNSATVTDNGTNKSVTLPATNSPQFFRLRRP